MKRPRILVLLTLLITLSLTACVQGVGVPQVEPVDETDEVVETVETVDETV